MIRLSYGGARRGAVRRPEGPKPGRAELLLAHEGGGSCGLDPLGDDVVVLGRDEHDHRRRIGPADAPGGLEAVHLRHADVHENELGRLRRDERKRFLAGGGLADGLESRRSIDDVPRNLAEDCLVVDGQHGDGSRVTLCVSRHVVKHRLLDGTQASFWPHGRFPRWRRRGKSACITSAGVCASLFSAAMFTVCPCAS